MINRSYTLHFILALFFYKVALVIRVKSMHKKEADGPSEPFDFITTDEDRKQRCHMADNPMASNDTCP